MAVVSDERARCARQRQDRGDALGTRDFAGVDHDTDLHEGGVYLAAPRVDDVDVVLTDGLGDADMALPQTALGHFSPCERYPQPGRHDRQR